MNSPAPHFTLRRLFLSHLDEVEVRRYWQHQDLQHRLARPEDMGAALGRGFEYDKRDHWPPLGPQQRRDRDGYAVGRIGIKSRMRLGTNRPIFSDIQIKQQLVSIEIRSETAEGWPLTVIIGRRSKIAV